MFDLSSVSILLVWRMKILLENSSTKHTNLFFSFSFPSPLFYFPMFSRQPNGRETNGSSVLGTITFGNMVLRSSNYVCLIGHHKFSYFLIGYIQHKILLDLVQK